ncbi:MAG: glycosyltransferase family 4 protein [Oscillospiraceae bacterium]|nr:glycosyltransferase family 4 protein [Oscillospiraceae bacterium]
MKKVLFVATVVRLHLNLFHLPYLRWFHEQGWQVDVAANNDFEDPDDCVIPCCDHHYVMPFERSPFKMGNLKAYRQLKELLDRERYDIIHCHTPMGGVIARLAAGSARNKGTKVLYTAHGFHFYDGAPLVNWLLYYPVERLLSHRTDLLLTMNGEDHRRAQTFHARRTEMVNGVGIDLSRFTEASPEQRSAVRRELGLEDGDIFAFTVGNVIPRKNQAVLIRAAKELNNPRFHLFIAGDGPLEPELKALAKELGIENQVHLLGFRRDVCRLSSAADIFLFSSRQEGLSVSVMEAMACGLPIVASAIRGNTDLIDPGQGGFLVAPDDAEGFADAIQKILADAGIREQMKRYNLEKIRNYSSQAVLQQMARLYASVM